MSTSILPLAGVRIIDFSHVFQGPVATQLLADFGADVIKIERPGSGDWSRQWGPFVGGVSLPFANLNRNKRCVSIDMKQPDGLELVIELIGSADVLVHNFRVGVMEKIGLGYETLHEKFPHLIFATSSGWGDDGPYADRARPGHDLMARAEAGWFYQPADGVKPAPAGISIDYPAGLMLAQGILLALLARAKTGLGQRVSTDLLSVAFHAHAWDAAANLNPSRRDAREGVSNNEQVIDKSFCTADGWIEVSPVFSPNALRDISTALGLDDLSAEARYATPDSRFTHRDEINERLGAVFRTRTTEEWLADLEKKGILCARIRTFAEAADDPQIAANQMIVEIDHPDAGSLRLLGTPVRLSAAPTDRPVAPAAPGQHNAEVLAEMGYTHDAIEALIARGILCQW
jgi:crotonobetainyl-CoA:carnitine CoA-transferase CaiB-like acyl-CoA transferase